MAHLTYKQNDNFLVKNIDSVPILIENYEKPFRILDKSELKSYILSNNYWANSIAIYALCEKLKLNVIPISIKNLNNKNVSIDIPFANFGTEYNKWRKYLFLYYDGGHFELMTFNYKKKTLKLDSYGGLSTIKHELQKNVIFERNTADVSELPPVYILFIIFSSWYMSIPNDNDFTYQKKIMSTMRNALNELYNSSRYTMFYNTFTSYFISTRLMKPKSEERLISDSPEPVDDIDLPPEINDSELKGGYQPPPQYYRPPPQYYRPQSQYYQPQPYYNPYQPYGTPAYKIMKKEENKDDTQLAYYITIDLEVHPGTSVTPEEMKNLKCRQKWNSVRKAWSEFTGKPYVIPPVYQTKTLKNKEQNPIKTQYKRPIPKNNTRKYRPNPNYTGGKRNKTIKLN